MESLFQEILVKEAESESVRCSNNPEESSDAMVVKVENDDDEDIVIDLEELEGAISEEKELDFDVEDLEKYLD